MRKLALCLCLCLTIGSVYGRAGAGDSEKTTSAKGPKPALHGLHKSGKMRISASDRCPVCGMFPARRPKSAAAMQLKDGRTFYFCGNGCLLRTWRHSRLHLGVSAQMIAKMKARDYFTGATLDADSAWWVAGSDVIGPMGPAIVALGTEKDRDAFQSRHGGHLSFQLSEMDDALWKTLFPKKGHHPNTP